MSQYGINVPPGIPVFKVDEVPAAAEKMKDESGDVSCLVCTFTCSFASCPAPEVHGLRWTLPWRLRLARFSSQPAEPLLLAVALFWPPQHARSHGVAPPSVCCFGPTCLPRPYFRMVQTLCDL